MSTYEELKEVKRRYSASLRRLPGVAGVDIDRDPGGGYILAVYLDSADPDARRRLPDEIEGHRVKYIVSGPFEKQSKPDS